MRAAGLGPGDTVLAPAFHHGSEIEAFHQAGLGCRFYEVTERFEPDPEELDQLLEPSVRALHLVHYLGFPQQSASWRLWCDDRGLLLIEDAAQAWLARLEDTPVGCHGDVSVFCLYKTYGVPDGAALWTRAIDATGPLPGRGGLGAVARPQASWLLQRSSGMSALREAFEHRPAFSHAEDIALGDTRNGPSRATVRLLPRLGGEAATKRRANYRWLMDRLGEHVPPPFRVLPAGASPFVFPIETVEKDLVAERLRRHRIEALGFWTLPHPSLPEGFDRSAAARRRWLGCRCTRSSRRKTSVGSSTPHADPWVPVTRRPGRRRTGRRSTTHRRAAATRHRRAGIGAGCRGPTPRLRPPAGRPPVLAETPTGATTGAGRASRPGSATRS
jgi:hypothetical protein